MNARIMNVLRFNCVIFEQVKKVRKNPISHLNLLIFLFLNKKDTKITILNYIKKKLKLNKSTNVVKSHCSDCNQLSE